MWALGVMTSNMDVVVTIVIASRPPPGPDLGRQLVERVEAEGRRGEGRGGGGGVRGERTGWRVEGVGQEGRRGGERGSEVEVGARGEEGEERGGRGERRTEGEEGGARGEEGGGGAREEGRGGWWKFQKVVGVRI